MVMIIGDYSVIGGLPVRWQRFPVAHSDHSDPDTAFGLWVPCHGAERPRRCAGQKELPHTDADVPYFIIIWPSAELLVTKVLGGPDLSGKRVLDLGCGLGHCGFAAACRSARVTFLDREPRALEIVSASTHQQTRASASSFECIVADWREPPHLQRFDLILGSDVLYEESSISPLAAFLAAHLELDAESWIADPGRPYAGLFFDTLQEYGLELRGTEVAPAERHEHVGISLIRIGRRSVPSLPAGS